MTENEGASPGTGSPKRQLSPALVLASVFCLVSVGFALAAALGWFDAEPLEPEREITVQVELPFDLNGLSIPESELIHGGPEKDVIPALSMPDHVSADEAVFLNDEHRVIGAVLSGEARAYPLSILDYHEAVNDEIGEVPVAVTYCPLCDSAIAFDRRVNGRTVDFGISGLLYNCNVLLFDRNSDSPEGLWTQLGARCISGPDAGTALKSVPCELTTWSDWRTRFPETLVLSNNTGHDRVYDGNAYAGYFLEPYPMFPATPIPDRTDIALKDRVLGLWSGDSARAYPLAQLRDGGRNRTIADELEGSPYTLEYNHAADTIRVLEAAEGIEYAYSMWFAWYAFHPETEVSGPPAE